MHVANILFYVGLVVVLATEGATAANRRLHARGTRQTQPLISRDFQTPPSQHLLISTDGSQSKKPPGPRVFFLFLTKHGVDRPDLWNAFFNGASQDSYRSFMHCSTKDACNKNGTGAVLVKPVRAEYCKDLVSPMVQLLKAARAESISVKDKFVFVSESTLPAKPLSIVYNVLTSSQESDFCISPRQEWLKLGSPKSSSVALLVTHSQWVVLSRDHAGIMLDAWPKFQRQNTGDWQATLWAGTGDGPAYGNASDTVNLPRDMPLCFDEWAVFTSIYGLIQDHGQNQVQGLPGFGTKPLWLDGTNALQYQSNCRTFTDWGRLAYDSPQSELIQQIYNDKPHSRLVCPGIVFEDGHLRTQSGQLPCTDSHPVEIAAISDHSAKLLRRSPFLFARKFQKEAMTVKQFSSIILRVSVEASLLPKLL